MPSAKSIERREGENWLAILHNHKTSPKRRIGNGAQAQWRDDERGIGKLMDATPTGERIQVAIERIDLSGKQPK